MSTIIFIADIPPSSKSNETDPTTVRKVANAPPSTEELEEYTGPMEHCPPPSKEDYRQHYPNLSGKQLEIISTRHVHIDPSLDKLLTEVQLDYWSREEILPEEASNSPLRDLLSTPARLYRKYFPA